MIESLVCHEVVLLTCREGFKKIIIEGDCKPLIKAINRDDSPPHIQSVTHDIRTIAQEFEEISLCDP